MQELQKATGKAPDSWEGSDASSPRAMTSEMSPEGFQREAEQKHRQEARGTETPGAGLFVMFYQANKDKHCTKNKRGASQVNRFRKLFKYSSKEYFSKPQMR